MLCLNIYLYIFGIEIGFKNDISYNFNYKLFKWSSFWSNIEELFALCNFNVGSDSELMWCVTRVAILSEIFLTYYSGRYWHYSSERAQDLWGCGASNENECAFRILCLNIWSPLTRTVWEILGGLFLN